MEKIITLWVLEFCLIKMQSHNCPFKDDPLKYLDSKETALFIFILNETGGDWLKYDSLLKSAIEKDIFFLGDIEGLITRLHLFYQLIIIDFDRDRRIMPVKQDDYRKMFDRDQSIQYLANFFEKNK